MNKNGTNGCSVPIEQRFWKFVDKAGPDQCWLWNGNRNRSPQDGNGSARTGHGTVHHNGGAKVASRVCWEIVNGPIPDGMCVCHKCDVPLCVNPNHLFLGTKKDNTQDAYKKGRRYIRKGSEVNTSKLTAEQVLQIRKDYTGRYGQCAELSRKYGLKIQSMFQIVKGTTWKHIH